MKGRRFIVFISLLAGFALSASMLGLQYQAQRQGFGGKNPSSNKEIRKEKFTILPIILVSGFRFFQKVVEKK